jgi:hypothetical protein
MSDLRVQQFDRRSRLRAATAAILVPPMAWPTRSAAAGERLQIMVSTDPAEMFQLEVFRTGYYGGRGARLMTTPGPFQGQPQPVPTPNERTLHECQWEPAPRPRCSRATDHSQPAAPRGLSALKCCSSVSCPAM